jgi:hypothetical protein
VVSANVSVILEIKEKCFVEWFKLAQDKFHLLSVVHNVTNLWGVQDMNNCQLLKKDHAKV